MSYSGHILTSSSGANVPPSIDERDRTATTANIQVNLNIKPAVDSVDTGQQTRIRPEEWKYQANASRPLLPPVHTNRARSAGEDLKPNEDWKGEFQELVETLPDDIRELFLKEQQLPTHKRTPSLLVMEENFILAAKFIAWVKKAAMPEPAGSIAEALTLLNKEMGDLTKKGVVHVGGESLTNMRESLEQLGRNFPAYDGVNYHLMHAESSLTLLKQEGGKDE